MKKSEFCKNKQNMNPFLRRPMNIKKVLRRQKKDGKTIHEHLENSEEINSVLYILQTKTIM